MTEKKEISEMGNGVIITLKEADTAWKEFTEIIEKLTKPSIIIVICDNVTITEGITERLHMDHTINLNDMVLYVIWKSELHEIYRRVKSDKNSSDELKVTMKRALNVVYGENSLIVKIEERDESNIPDELAGKQLILPNEYLNASDFTGTINSAYQSIGNIDFHTPDTLGRDIYVHVESSVRTSEEQKDLESRGKDLTRVSPHLMSQSPNVKYLIDTDNELSDIDKKYIREYLSDRILRASSTDRHRKYLIDILDLFNLDKPLSESDHSKLMEFAEKMLLFSKKNDEALDEILEKLEEGDANTNVQEELIMKRVPFEIYYCNIARAILARGTCKIRNYGAVIVKNDEIVATGYTGSPRGEVNCIDKGDCFRKENGIPSGQQYDKCLSVHAEQNAMLSASRSQMIGASIYLVGEDRSTGKLVDAQPCGICMKLIKNSGITKIYTMDSFGNVTCKDVK